MRSAPLVAICGVLVVVGGVGAAAVLLSTPAAKVERRVRAQLFDPDSAKFSSVTFNAKKDAGCGVVNAKNRYGGYTGARHFVLFNDNTMKFQPEGAADTAPVEQRIAALNASIEYLDVVRNMCGDEAKME